MKDGDTQGPLSRDLLTDYFRPFSNVGHGFDRGVDVFLRVESADRESDTAVNADQTELLMNQRGARGAQSGWRCRNRHRA